MIYFTLPTDLYFGSLKQIQLNWSIFSNTYQTLAFDESVLGWTSRFTYKPEQAFSVKSKYYSVNEGKLYQHNYQQVGQDNNRGKFYGIYSDSNITFIFNRAIYKHAYMKEINFAVLINNIISYQTWPGLVFDVPLRG